MAIKLGEIIPRKRGIIQLNQRFMNKSGATNVITGVSVGIDASRNLSGGAIAHIKGLINGGDPSQYGIDAVHLWAHGSLLDALPDNAWLVKHPVAASPGSILRQIAWQRFRLPAEARRLGVQVMFNTDAGSVCPFQPSVTLSQDMLSYEPGEMRRYPWLSKARLRLEILRIVQLRRLGASSASVFLTRYAANVIAPLARARRVDIIPHGIDQRFLVAGEKRRPFPPTGPVNCLYVSNAAPYKHQWHVIEGIARARKLSGRDLRLRLVGGASGSSQRRVKAAVRKFDPGHAFVEQVDFVPNEIILQELAQADVFVFASSCENMPITLLEAMAVGLPIASSDRGPMTEVLDETASFFDPENPAHIAEAICTLLENPDLSVQAGQRARNLARSFTWERCAAATWQLLLNVANMNNNQGEK